MFTVFDLKESTPLASDELRAVWRVLDDYSRTAAGAWLRGFPFRRFELRWCPAMNDAVMGAFLPARPRVIYLMPPADYFAELDPKIFSDGLARQLRDQARITWAEFITPTVIHELRHAWQFARCPWLYVLCSLPVLREYTLELDAQRIGREAENIVESTVGWHDGRKFERGQREKADSGRD